MVFSCDTIDNHSEIKSESIEMALSKNEKGYFRDKTIKGKLDFCKGAGSVGNFYSYISSTICFQNCVFEDSVVSCTDKSSCIFDKEVHFVNCTFKNGLDFSNSEFRTLLDMAQSNIEGQARFANTKFNKTIFISANFQDEVIWSNSDFCGDTDFRKTFYKKGCFFQNNTFYKPVIFDKVYFYGYTEFSNIKAYSIFDFCNCKIKGDILITHSTFYDYISLKGTAFSGESQSHENYYYKAIDTTFADIQNIERKNNYYINPK